MTPAERIIALLDERKIEYKDFAESIGVKAQKISEWKNGTTKSYNKHLPEICNALGVTTDYILYGDSDNPEPPQKEPTRQEIDKLIDEMPESKQEALLNFLKTL